MKKSSTTKGKRRKKILIIALIIIILLLNIVGFTMGVIVYDKICKVQINKNIDNYQYYRNTFDYVRFSTLDTEDVQIKSSFGYNLSGTYIKNPVPTLNTVIIVHGFRGSRWESMKYADMYIDDGFNVLVYDSRYHGKSGGDDITMGYLEKFDLNNCVEWVESNNPNGIIGVHGESLGAATALLHSKMNEENKKVKFYVADCAYSDLSELLRIQLKDNIAVYNPIIGNFISFYCNLVVLIKSGFTLYSVSPINAIKKVKTPILFIHGVDDSFIPATMSIDMYMVKPYPKGIYIAPNADHAQAYLYNIIEYREKVYGFLKEYVWKN